MGLAIVVLLKPAAGDQRYVVAPVAVSEALLPLQIVKEGLAVTVRDGIGFTVTVFVSEAEHPPTVTVDVNAVLVVGFTVMLDVVPPWLHKYVLPAEAEAMSVVDCPLQIVRDGFPEMETVGVGFTVTEIVFVSVHMKFFPVTV